MHGDRHLLAGYLALGYIWAKQTENMETVQMTPRVLEESYLPALQEVAQNLYQGKIAYAVMKNYREALKMRAKVEDFRNVTLRELGETDDKGELILIPQEGRPHQVKMSDEAKKKFEDVMTRHYTDHLYDLRVHRVSEQHICEEQKIRPVVLVMLAPMFNKEEEAVEITQPLGSPLSVVKDEIEPETELEPEIEVCEDPNNELPL